MQIDSQIKTDIQNAVNAGKVVTVSKSNISFNGWNGCGYIITDPETGAGAYMISGGTSGAAVFFIGSILMSWAPLIIMLMGITLLSPVGIVLAALTGLGVGMVLSQAWNPDWDIRTVINMIVQGLIEGIVAAEIAIGLSLSAPALLALIILWVISQALEYNIGSINLKKLNFKKSQKGQMYA